MTRQDHLLFILAEECSELAQRASKAARFGMQEIQPGQPLSNEDRLVLEIEDVLAAIEMLGLAVFVKRQGVEVKKDKVEKFLRYSAELGRLET